jgi:hypothetical protein
LSIDWSSSLGDALMAQWRSTGIGCPAGQFAVLTFDGEDGSFDLSNSVSFTFMARLRPMDRQRRDATPRLGRPGPATAGLGSTGTRDRQLVGRA